jgi:hypothetical protein
MPFALIFIGLILVVTGIRDTYQQLGSLVYGDFTGQRGGAGFIMFFIAIAAVGALGAIPEARKFSHYFMALILISLLLHNSQFFSKLVNAAKGAGKTTPVNTSGTATGGGAFSMFGAPSSGVLGQQSQVNTIQVNLPNVTGVHL